MAKGRENTNKRDPRRVETRHALSLGRVAHKWFK